MTVNIIIIFLVDRRAPNCTTTINESVTTGKILLLLVLLLLVLVLNISNTKKGNN